MIIGTDRGTGGNNTGATTLVITPASDLPGGSFGVLCVAVDNAGSGGSTAICPGSMSDSAGNTWTLRQNPIFDPGAASAGVEIGLYTCALGLNLPLTTGGNITITWGGGTSPVAKAWTLASFMGNAAGGIIYNGGSGQAGSTTGTPSFVTDPVLANECVICMGGAESADTWAGDTDTLNGPWSTHQHNGFGTGTNGMSVTSQYKTVTNDGAQTYSPTLTSADCILAFVIIHDNSAGGYGFARMAVWNNRRVLL